ncbi:MAG: histone acetyltransferase 1 [Candelina submexicana]|nr:MAG: histone acetyltransferase 1 [Candelina submexicana]
MAESDEWSTKANQAVQLSLIQPGAAASKELVTFHPAFTYPIFGDEETIFGYQGLNINIRFAAHNLQSNVEISWDRKFKTIGETKATDIKETLKPYLPETAFEKSSNFDTHIQSDILAQDFKPPGKLTSTYTSKGSTFEIWCGELRDPVVERILRRMEIFVSFFIEGGTPIQTDGQDWTTERWKVFLLYEKLSTPPTSTASPYSFIGYATAYRYYLYNRTSPPTPPSTPPQRYLPSAKHTFKLSPSPEISPSSLPCRERISQFIILPPYQHSGHGTHLYRALYTTFVSDHLVREITVEDPSEAFDDLRDYCDFAHLHSNNTFAQIKLLTPPPSKKNKRIRISTLLDQSLLSTLRTRNKIAPRQFARLVEMYLLSQIPSHHRRTERLTRKENSPDENDRAYYFWRLVVKQRLYKHNRDEMMQLDRLDRIDKLEEVLGIVEGDYLRLLRGVEERRKKGLGSEVVEGATNGDRDEDDADGEGKGKRERTKRKVIFEDEDADEEEERDEKVPKKAKG